MSRYIDAEALEEHMQAHYNELCTRYGQYDHFVMGYSDAMFAIEEAPTKDIAMVVVDKKITREQELSLKGTEFKEYIKKQMAVELAHYLLETGYIQFLEDRGKELITIMGLVNVLGAKMDGERKEANEG